MSREMPTKRKYELKKRAEEMAETHLRITEAAIELHGTVGPVAHDAERGRRAGGRGAPHALPPLPHRGRPVRGLLEPLLRRQPVARSRQTGARFAIRSERLERALDELYAYYERTEPMLSNVLRDAELVDSARDAVAPLHAYLEEAAEILAAGRGARGRSRQLLGGALRHALAFSTWRSLSANGLERSDAVRLVTALVEGAGPRPQPGYSSFRQARGSSG